MEVQSSPQDIADEIISWYERFGNMDYIGENISQVEHMGQCAQLAASSGATEEVVLAAFLHDIGHLYEYAFPESKQAHLDEFGIIDHEKLGANYLLSQGFAPKIALLVHNHVSAKRYLTYHSADYFDQLSSASKITLAKQGGAMSLLEAINFESNIYYKDYIALRRWDDQAKNMNMPYPNLSHYHDMIMKHLATQNMLT